MVYIEQLSLSVTYIDNNKNSIKENCICFVPVFEYIGENLVNTVIQKLKNFNLSLEFLSDNKRIRGNE